VYEYRGVAGGRGASGSAASGSSQRGGKVSGKMNILNEDKIILCAQQILNCLAK
jgi:hypothetical protein